MADEVIRICCPQCNFRLDPVEVARQLPLEILKAERARRSFNVRRRQAGPGRPKGVARCPSCLGVFVLERYHEHVLTCLPEKLTEMRVKGKRLHVWPMDATQYRDFIVSEVRDEIVVLMKLSNDQYVDVPLRSIREIMPAVNDEVATLSLRGGRLRWNEEKERWKFSPV